MQLFIFDHYMNELKTILTESDVISATETKEINKAGTLDVQVPLKVFDIKETDMLLVWTGKENRYHVYRVIQRNVNDSILTIKANEYGYHLFKADGIIHDKRPNNMPIKELLQHVIIDNSEEGIGGWEVGYVSDDLPNFTGNFYREDRLSCLSKIASACNAEFEFIFTIKDNKIDKRLLEAYDQIGVDTGKRFEYGDNLLSIVAETDASAIYTRAYGFGAGVESGDGYGRKLDMTGVAWSTEKGDPVTKVDWWDFIVDTRGNWKDYQLDNGTDPSTIFEFSDCKVENPEDPNSVMEAKEKLTRLTFNALQEVNRPKVQFKAQVAYAGDLKLGDRVDIIRSDINVRYKTRVFKTVTNLVNPALTTIELGDKVGTTTSEMIESITNKINGTVNQITDIKNDITLIENNTGNHIHYSPDMPGGSHKKGDAWFETHEIEGGTQTTIHIWDGEKWVVSYDPKIFEELNTAIEEAKNQTQEALDRADEAVQKGEDLENAFGSAILDITDKVDNAVSDIQENKAETDKKIEDAVKDFENKNNATSEKVDNAIKNFEENKNDLNNKITEVDKKADGIQTTVKDLEANTESKFTQLNDVIQSKVNKDEFEASQTITNEKIEQVVKDNTANSEKISSLTQTAEGIQANVSNLEKETNSKLTILDDAIQQKVNKEDFEATTNNLGDQITQTVKKIDNIKIGAVNLIANSNPMPKLVTYPNNTESETRGEWQRFNVDDVREQEILPKNNIFMKLDEDVSFIQQITVKTDGELKRAVFSLYSNSDGHDYKEATIKKIYDNAYMIYIVVTGNGREVRLIDITTIEIEGGTFVEFQHPQLERGTVPSDWSPNPDDLPTAEQVSEISQKADSIGLSVKDLKENTESRLDILDGAIQSKVSKDDYEASQTIVNNQITQIVKDTTTNAEKISQVDQKADGIQVKVDDLEKDTSSKITILDDLIKSTVAQLGASYPNGNMSDDRIENYYESYAVNNKEAVITDYVQGVGLRYYVESNDDARYIQIPFKKKPYYSNYNNLMWFDLEYELYTEKDASVYIQCYYYNENDEEINHEFFNLKNNVGRTTQTHNFWYPENTQYVSFVLGSNMPDNCKIDLKLYKMKMGANENNTMFNMYFKDTNYDRYFEKNSFMSPITKNTKNKVLKLPIIENQNRATAKLKDFIEVDSKEELNLSFKSLVEYNWESKRECFVILEEYNKDYTKVKSTTNYIKYDNSCEWYENNLIYKLQQETKFIKIEWKHQFNDTYTSTMYIDDVYIKNGRETVSSSISQLADDINIKVDKNDVINQINVSDEEVLIAGNRIHLTGQTIIDDAIITSAMIKDLTADKITAGTINGENINIVNVRAENIIGNTTNFVQSAWNSINRSIRINGDGITFINDNDENLIINNHNIEWTSASGETMLKFERVFDNGSHGAVALNVAPSQSFHIGASGDGYWKNIIEFQGSGDMRVPEGEKIYIGGPEHDQHIMFYLAGMDGLGVIGMLGNGTRQSGIGFAGPGIVVLKDGSWSWLK